MSDARDDVTNSKNIYLIDKLYFKINKIVFKTANVFDLIDHHQIISFALKIIMMRLEKAEIDITIYS